MIGFEMGGSSGYLSASVRASLLCLVTILLLAGCSQSGNEDDTEVMRWADPQSEFSIALLLRKRGVKNLSVLQVNYHGEKGSQVEKVLDDDVRLATVRFIKTADWIVVTNGQYAIGGYNRRDNRLIGEYEWSKLPFLVWNGREGDVLVSKADVQTLEAVAPAGFPSTGTPD